MKKEYRIKVLNKYVDSRNLELINDFVGERFWCNAIYNDEGLVTDDPKASTVLHMDDEIINQLQVSGIDVLV